MRRALFFLPLFLLFQTAASADLTLEYECRSEKTGMEAVGIPDGTLDYKRRLLIRGPLFAFQVMIDGRLRREYGFDFERNFYYEADPEADRYETFDLDRIGEEYERMGLETTHTGRRGDLVTSMSHALLEGIPDYAIAARRSFFRRKNIHGFKTALTHVSMGPGSSILNPVGWYRRADVWGTTQIPDYGTYRDAVVRLQEKGFFYKLKYNLISDHVAVLLAVKDVPVETDSVAKRRFAQANAEEKDRESLVYVSTEPIDPGELLYVRDAAHFKTNVLFEGGSEIDGGGRSLRKPFRWVWERTLPWVVVPVLFFVFSFLWVSSISHEDARFSLKRRLFGRLYAVFAALFIWQWAHFFLGFPFFGSLVLEFSLLLGAGVLASVLDARFFLHRRRRRMEEANLRFCPHCRKPIETFYRSCPECRRDLP